MAKLIRFALVFVVGFSSGTIFTSYLGYRVLATYRQIVHVNLVHREETLTSKAARSNDALEEVIHSWNVVQLRSPDGAEFFQANDPVADSPLLWPLRLLILRQVVAGMDPDRRGQKLDQGLSHGYLAIALERLGSPERAAAEWERASQLVGRSREDTEKNARELHRRFIAGDPSSELGAAGGST